MEPTKVTAEQVRLAAKIVSIDDTIEVIRANREPKSGWFHENETAKVIRYLQGLKDEIVGAVIR